MSIPHILSEQESAEKLKEKLGKYYYRALNIFNNYGATESYQLTDIFQRLTNLNHSDTTILVLHKLENHWEHRLNKHEPKDCRNRRNDPTLRLYQSIYQIIESKEVK